MRMANSQAVSLAAHVAALAALAAIGSRSIAPPAVTRPGSLVIPLIGRFRPVRRAEEAHRGGSHRTAQPTRRGSPPTPSHRTFILPPTVEHAALPLAQTVAFIEPAPIIDDAEAGDPFSRYSQGAFGFGGGTSLGDGGCCESIGPGRSGSPGYSADELRRMTPPRLLYRVEPEFSEDARKAKHQGVVVLYIDIDTNGRARNIRVARQLGLGLDEKAVEAVSEWRFRPAYLDGKPVVASAVVEVNFHLL
jgi:periplasmic protein TonB